MNLHIVLNGNSEKSFDAINGFTARCGSRCRGGNPHGALHSKVAAAGDSR
ncbi:hypothetical protein GCM10008931_03120 [Oceanobacillus oncorhynchi subsp. oncorhynchi]